MAIKFAGQPCIDPDALLRLCQASNLPKDRWYRYANHFRVPIGETPGSGVILMQRADFQKVNTSQPNTLTFDSGLGDGPLTLQKIEVEKYEDAFASATGDNLGIVVVTLADRRKTFQQLANKAYNVRNSDASGWQTSSLNSGTPWTWKQIIDDLWAVVFGISAPTLGFTPNGTPENFIYWETNAWKAVNLILTRIGCSTVYRPDTDTFTIARIGTAAPNKTAAIQNLSEQVRYQTQANIVNRINRPEKIRVLFRKSISTITDLSIDPYYVVDTTVTPTAAGVITGSMLTLFDDMIGTASNSAARSSRAAERVADWIRIRDNYETAPYVFSYAGYTPKIFGFLGEQGREVAFVDFGNGECSEASSGIFPEWFPTMGTGGGVGGASTPSNAVLISTGTLITPGGGDLPYYAATEQYVTGGWNTASTVRAINTGTADPKSGKRYPATFVGFAVDGVTRCYAIKAGKTEVVTDASISCDAGTVTLSLTKTFLDIDPW